MREAAAAATEVNVLIINIDREKRRVALALAPEGAELGQQMESRVEVGAVLKGTVERHEPFGAFVRLGPGQTGLVPTGELSMSRGADARKTFPVDSEIKVLVLAIEEGGPSDSPVARAGARARGAGRDPGLHAAEPEAGRRVRAHARRAASSRGSKKRL